ncbi:MAG TPA: DUF3347 domain-containing protein [Daejeonella sp.]|nr:DUF3347 domain-containing protein [Daejeonella sp.]
MKKIFFIVAFIAIGLVQTYALDRSPLHVDLLTHYYAIKDALVASKADLAATHAAEFVKAAALVDAKNLPDANRALLVKDASAIASAKDLKKQRELFSAFSENMAALAKVTKLGHGNIYKAYCPMKKASWLSKEPAIKNPYYGSTMLTCGKVVETIK